MMQPLAPANRRFEFNKRRQLFIRTHRLFAVLIRQSEIAMPNHVSNR
jgi:hypothetical protein